MTRRTSCMDAALHYAKRGLSVLPLHPPDDGGTCSCRDQGCDRVGKHPIADLAPKGVHSATTDKRVIKRWFDKRPRANVGIATGKGLVVLDVDPRHNGNWTMDWIEEAHEPLDTLVCETGDAGTHYYVLAEGIPTRSSVLEGVDVKGEAGYAVAPPSRHKSGKAYRWRQGGPSKPQVAPDWLLELIRPRPSLILSKSSVAQAPDGGLPEDIEELLQAIPASIGHDEWLRVGMGLHRADPDKGFDLWDSWSATCPEKYPGQRKLLQRWKSFDLDADPAVTVGTIRHLVREHTNGQKRSQVVPERSGTEPVDETESEDRPRPVIVIRPELTGMTDDALEAIVARPDLNVFIRARMPVTVARDGSSRDRWLERSPGAPVIVPIGKALMREILDRAAQWEKPDKRAGGGLKPAMPPALIATQILARTEWDLPYLEAVIETPTLRRDGTVLDQPGHDETTGLLYLPAPGSPTWPTVPDQPSTEEIADAVAALLDPVVDFPFLSESDRAAYVAAVLTLVARHLVDGPVPLFAVRAPTPGTGKTLLVLVISLIATGRRPSTMTMARDSDEFRKRITSIALAGDPMVLLDNVSGSLGSDALAGALTASEWEDRILGHSEMVRLPLRAVWVATGNNLGFKRTLGRRVIPVDLDAEIENPEDRTEFRHPNLEEHLREARPRLATAAMTIVRGFLLAGRPEHGGPRMGAFEAWDDLIRSAVVWAGLDDPAAIDDPTRGRGRVRADADDDVEALGAVLDQIASNYPNGQQFAVADLIKRAETTEDLSLALDGFAPSKNGKVTSRTLGYQLRGVVNRPVGGLRLTSHKRGKHGRMYQVRSSGGDDGVDSDDESGPRDNK